MNSTLKMVLQHCGVEHAELQTVTGGDINSTYRVRTKQTSFFLKLNDAAAYPFMFQREADGLAALKKYSGCIVPQVVTTGVAGDL